jgi:hypothetical protein
MIAWIRNLLENKSWERYSRLDGVKALERSAMNAWSLMIALSAALVTLPADQAGVGYGIFIYDLRKAKRKNH